MRRVVPAGYLDQAEAHSTGCTAEAERPDAYYNLGTLCLRKNKLRRAPFPSNKRSLIRQDYPEAWNNLA